MKGLRQQVKKIKDAYEENFPIFPWKYTEKEREEQLLKCRRLSFDLEEPENAIYRLEVSFSNYYLVS